MNTSSILVEQKRAELQVKLTILKENIANLKTQLESTLNETNINSQIQNTDELCSLKKYQQTSLENEVAKESKTLEGLKVYCSNLKTEKENSISENNFYLEKLKNINAEISQNKQILEEIRQRKQNLQNELEKIKNEHDTNSKISFAREQQCQTSMNAKESISYFLSENAKKVQVLQVKIDNLNNDIAGLTNELNSLKCSNDETDEYNNEIERRAIVLKENSGAFNRKLLLIQREIDETKDYIQSSKEDREKMNKDLDSLAEAINQINKVNLHLNASLSIIMDSLQKKERFIQGDEEYFSQCNDARNKLIAVLKDIDSYHDLI